MPDVGYQPGRPSGGGSGTDQTARDAASAAQNTANTAASNASSALSAAVANQPTQTTLFGTLGTEQVASGTSATQNLTDLINAGFTQAMFECNWANMQQGAEGVDTSSWVTDFQTRLSNIQAAGFNVTLETGHFNQPSWVTGLDASYFHTKVATGATVTNLNLTWSAAARLKWQAYVDHLHTNFDLTSFQAVRIGASGAGELLYPSGSYYVGGDAAAQTGVGLAAGQTVCPVPGWIPGSGDTSITTAQAQAWLDWYVQSLVNQAVWMMTYIRSKGFTGFFEILMPGQGTSPSQETTAVASYLPTSAGGTTIARAALWHKIAKLIPNTGDVRLHQSSTGDQSGSPTADNYPTVADADLNVGTSKGTTYNNWSGPRRLAYQAKRYGFPLSMENVGYTGGFTHYYDLSASGLPAAAFAQVDAFKPEIFYWAHANQLFGSGHLAPLSGSIAPYTTARTKTRKSSTPVVARPTYRGLLDQLATKRSKPALVTATAATVATPLVRDTLNLFNPTANLTNTALPSLANCNVGDTYWVQNLSNFTVTQPFASGDTSVTGAISAALTHAGTVELTVVATAAGVKYWSGLNHVRSDTTLDGLLGLYTPAAGLAIPSGRWLRPTTSTISTVAPGTTALYAFPFRLRTDQQTFTDFAVEVTTAAAANGILRLGFAPDINGAPDQSNVTEVGSIDTTATGYRQLPATTSITLRGGPSKRHWCLYVSQVSAATYRSAVLGYGEQIDTAALPGTNNSVNTLQANGASGSLTGISGLTLTGNNASPINLYFKTA